MKTQILVVENLEDWRFADIACPVVSADDYLTRQEYFKRKDIHVINLCRNYRYLGVAYYCSLLAEARGQKALPSVKTMLDISRKSMYTLNIDDLNALISKSLKRLKRPPDETTFEMTLYFGRCTDEVLAGLARQIFEMFPAPLLQVRFVHRGDWHIDRIKPLPLNRLKAEQHEAFILFFQQYLTKRWRARKVKTQARYDLAILHDPNDPLPPSDKKALQKFVKAGLALGVDVELIQKKDYGRLAEYDALLIRDTTNLDHYTYRFAKKAESEGMVVIDDPRSIQLCTNKVYLAELLHAQRVPAPKTVIVGKHDLEAAEKAIGYPMVLKVPDGSFSLGVYKVKDFAELSEVSARLFKDSELILAQEFLYTEFDWRIGVLNRKPLYASQYFMTKKHWQIVNYDGKGGHTEGAFKTWPVEEVPAEVVKVALKAANLIGDGLYGVDLKQAGKHVYVIEVNDNPNLDAGVEDAYLRDSLYHIIMAEFVRRLDAKHVHRLAAEA